MADRATAEHTALELTEAQAKRWETVVTTITGMLPAGRIALLVDGADGVDGLPAEFADRLAASVAVTGRACARLSGGNTGAARAVANRSESAVTIADGPTWGDDDPPPGGWTVLVWLATRTPRSAEGSSGADIVVDVHESTWPVLRRVVDRLAGTRDWHLRENQAFFSVRARTWDTKFGDDLPRYAAAVAAMDLRPGEAVLDVGCGTGRALPALREAVGPAGIVLGLDVTPEMLAVAREAGRAGMALLLRADARRLPVADRTLDGIFAAGFVNHLVDADTGLAELARVARPGARLAIYHPSGRAALAARHGRSLRDDEPLSAVRLGPLLTSAGWRLDVHDDGADRFFALARRV